MMNDLLGKGRLYLEKTNVQIELNKNITLFYYENDIEILGEEENICSYDNVFAIHVSKKNVELFNIEGDALSTKVSELKEDIPFQISNKTYIIRYEMNDVQHYTYEYENDTLSNFIDIKHLFLRYATMIGITDMQAVDVMTTIDIPEIHEV